MKNLIDQLKEEHKRLSMGFEKATNLEESSDEGKEAILSLINELFSHLEYEKEHLYPFLEEKGKNDPELEQTVVNFKGIYDFMPRLKEVLEDHAFGKNSNERSSSEVFENLLDQFKIRFDREEDSLYRYC